MKFFSNSKEYAYILSAIRDFFKYNPIPISIDVNIDVKS